MTAGDKKVHRSKITAATGDGVHPVRVSERAAAKKKRKAPQSAHKAEKKQETRPLYNPFFAYKKRRFPIWQRLVLLLSLCAVALVVGAMFGYGALGHGNPLAVFDTGTWQHILDFLKTD